MKSILSCNKCCVEIKLFLFLFSFQSSSLIVISFFILLIKFRWFFFPIRWFANIFFFSFFRLSDLFFSILRLYETNYSKPQTKKNLNKTLIKIYLFIWLCFILCLCFLFQHFLFLPAIVWCILFQLRLCFSLVLLFGDVKKKIVKISMILS